MTAVRVNPTPPKIDGLLDDEIWQYAPVASGFVQQRPTEGVAPTESTTIQIAYDDEALYIGVMAYDREPEKIVTRLARRDQFVDADRISISLDPYLDHQTGYWFAVMASGSVQDGSTSNDDWDDWTWDGVWDVRVAIHEKGWSTEFKIPYYNLRFSPKEEYTWGININRTISRKREWDQWVLKPLQKRGWVSLFGHLEGIRGIHPPTHLEVLPYAVTRSTFEPKNLTANPDGRKYFSNAGVDVRYGLTSNISLNATFNPDFGQVDADPAVLNLSVFETYYQERRPFFVEGSSTFQTPFQLFYSRRIGRRPGYLSIPAGAIPVDQPDFTTILGAAKLTGKTEHKTTFGLLEAVTSSEEATVEQTITDPVTGLTRTERQHARIEPLTNYLIGRVQQDIMGGNSNVGIIATAVNRHDAEPAYTGGVDWNLKWHQNTYGISGQVAGSRAGSFTNRQSGYAGQVELAKRNGWLTGEVSFEALSPQFNASDLGFIFRVNQINARLWLGLQKSRNWGPFRRMFASMNQWNQWNYKRANLGRGLGVFFNGELQNFWFVGGGVNGNFQTLDDLDTRGGPSIINPASHSFFVFLSTDSRKPVRANFSSSWGSNTGGSSWRSLSPYITIRPSTRFEVSTGPRYSWYFNNAQWVTNVDDNGDGINDHYAYGELTSQVLDLTTRADVLFNRNLTLQFYMQPFVAVGAYKNFKELARAASYEFTSYTGVSFNPDFSSRSLRSNTVLRWEYRPGSTMFFVWSRSWSAFSQDPSFARSFQGLQQGFSDLRQGTNLFLVKFNYWLNV
ncbi:MAG: carbohydrate binding family 9 domain-containing protein [Candidatus Latescibacteria bacterium]|nr:carbohydrate binding family 9 domain-containing protein [Candidatus Latescibacterota bacterium]